MLKTRAAEIQAAYLRIIDENKNLDGTYDISCGSPIHEQFADWLQMNPETRNHGQEALRIMRQHDKDNRPKRRGGQGTLFQPTATIPISESGARILMAEAKQAHLERWLEVRTSANTRENADFATDQEYILERMAAYRSPEQTLLDVERLSFGYQD